MVSRSWQAMTLNIQNCEQQMKKNEQTRSRIMTILLYLSFYYEYCNVPYWCACCCCWWWMRGVGTIGWPCMICIAPNRVTTTICSRMALCSAACCVCLHCQPIIISVAVWHTHSNNIFKIYSIMPPHSTCSESACRLLILQWVDGMKSKSGNLKLSEPIANYQLRMREY